MARKERKYNFYVSENKVVCTTTFMGKTIRGIAKCNPEYDEFDVEKGKSLALARCEAKLATKRLKRAHEKYNMLKAFIDDLSVELEDLHSYRVLCNTEFFQAINKLNALEDGCK
jgi:hypothetical protein